MQPKSENRDQKSNNQPARPTRPLVSEALTDGTLIEPIYKPDEGETFFCVSKDGEWRFQPEIHVKGHRYVPYAPDNNLLRNRVVLFPSDVSEYDSEEALLQEIQSFIHRYLVVSPLFEKIASYYVLFSWIFDVFNELPYLRARGDYGTGKTRFLLTIGSLSYKPIFASGASTISPLFRMLDAFRGTLIIDEGDFRWSDERSEMVKILNNGNARGFPVLRSETDGRQEYNPKAFPVFGPKLVGARGPFEDPALESRFLTEDMGDAPLRKDVPINLPTAYKDESQAIRNKLLLFRLRTRGKRELRQDVIDRSIEPRLNQVFAPLLSIVDDAAVRADILDLAKNYHREIVLDRGLQMEGQVLDVIRRLIATTGSHIAVKDITKAFGERYGSEYDRNVTTRWIGFVVRKKLGLKTHKSNGIYVLSPGEDAKLGRLYAKYGLDTTDDMNAETPNAGDIRDEGDELWDVPKPGS